MIGNLLRQLFKAFGISVRHHLSRLFGRRGPNLPNTRSMAGTIPTVGLDPVYTKTVTWRTDRNDLAAAGTAGFKDDGIYFVEDVHANYWPGWRDSANSFLDFSKDLLELMHAHYWETQLPTWMAESESGSSLALEVPEITTLIKEIRFFDSMVAIYKTRRLHAPRYIIA